MANKKTILVILGSLLSIQISFGQKDLFNFKQLSFEQGLPGINIRDIYQDSKGILWICIEAQGLCKFYGNQYTLYQEKASDSLSISSDFVNKVIEDKNGFLWVATDNGLNVFDRNKNQFKRYYHHKNDEKSLSSNIIINLFIDSKDQLWLGTENGLNRYNYQEDNFERFYLNKVGDSRQGFSTAIYDIHEYSPDTTLWLGTNRGLVNFNPIDKEYQYIASSGNNPIHDRINAIQADEKGVLWLGTHRGLDRFNPHTGKYIRWNYHSTDLNEYQNEGIVDIYYDNGSLWAGTYTKGIVIINPIDEKYQIVNSGKNNVYNLKSDHIRYIYKDNSSTFWICTKFEGLFRYEKNKEIFTNWPDQLKIFLSLKEKYVLAFYKDPKYKNVYWLGSKFDGLYKIDIDKGKLTQFTHKDEKPFSISSNRIHSISRSSNGRLYVATSIGLDYFDEKANTFTNISQIPINVITSDKNSNLWIGSFNGLFFMGEDEKIERYQQSDSFFKDESLDILQVYLDHQSTLWFSTRYNGLYSFNLQTNSLDHFIYDETTTQSISSDMIRPILMDSENRLWIGTKSNGLNLYDKISGEFTHYTTEDGLPVNFILGIQNDFENNIWISTFNGLCKFEPSTNTFTNFTKDYGLQGNIYELGVTGIFEDGSLLFGGHNGIDIFNPASIDKKEEISPIIITSFSIFENEFQSDINTSKTFNLDYDQNYLSFEFILADYSDYNRHQFAYKLIGVDNDWIYSGNRNYVSYSNLVPGDYTFVVKGANEFGTWNEKGISVKIIISPPFYQTIWFKVLFGLFTFMLVFTIYKIKSNQIKRSKLLLEKRIQSRTKKLQNALKELKEKQKKIKSQNKELSVQYDQIVDQKNHIEDIISELKKAHNELKLINSDLDGRVKERTVELVKINQELDRFVYSASHDLSAPLKSILGLVNIAKFENKDQALMEHFQYMERSVKKLEEVINSLAQFSRNFGHEIKIKEFLFEELVKEILEELKISYGSYKANIKLDFDPGMTIKTDYLRLKIIMSNLISNALRHRKKGNAPEIIITYQNHKKNIFISIKDNGIGIEDENLQKIFGMFYRANENSEGSGLGLYIVKETLDKLKGEIKVDSKVGEYSIFTLSLPKNRIT